MATGSRRSFGTACPTDYAGRTTETRTEATSTTEGPSTAPPATAEEGAGPADVESRADVVDDLRAEQPEAATGLTEAAEHTPPEGSDQIAPPGSRVARRQSGVRAVLARLPFDLGTSIPGEIEPVITELRRTGSRVDLKLILRAYEIAARAHDGQLRRSGEPYIIHPIGVAEILAALAADTPTLCAALLHDVVEDTDWTLAQIADEFGETTAALVDGVTKLERVSVQTKEEQQAESLRKMLVAMADDYRVLLIKLADRLHNMRTIHHMPRHKQEQKAAETLSIYAPLAHRLGMQQFKWELEDRSFQCLHPKRYDEIKSMVAERQPGRNEYLQTVVTDVTERLKGVKIRAVVTGRQKHYWSIYEKMVVRGKEFDEIYDLIGIRVIVDTVKDCYAALGTLHAVWRPVPGRFKDYIAMPKFNLYQSLHTTVVGPGGKTMEVQIRTHAMHRTAEYGVAAHWRYKESARSAVSDGTAGDTQWLDQMLDMESSTRDNPGEFMRNVQLDLYADEVFVFTPKGDIQQLPRGSTPVDLAYAIHTEVGHRTIGAKVSDRLVPLEYELRNGETVEILLSKSADHGPSRDWLEFVGSSRARSKIRAWFSRERREDAIEKGREDLRRTLAKSGRGWKAQIGSAALLEVAQNHNYSDLDALFRAIGDGHITAKAIAQQLKEKLDEAEGAVIPSDEDDDDFDAPAVAELGPRRASSEAVHVEGIDDVLVTLARCCSPVPPDQILGFVTRGRGISVHRTDCPNADDLRSDPGRLVPVHWNTTTPSTFRVTIDVEAFDRKHLLRDITTVLGDEYVSIVSANVTTKKDRVALLRFTFELADITHLDHVLRQIKGVEAVYDAYRVVPRTTNRQKQDPASV